MDVRAHVAKGQVRGGGSRPSPAGPSAARFVCPLSSLAQKGEGAAPAALACRRSAGGERARRAGRLSTAPPKRRPGAALQKRPSADSQIRRFANPPIRPFALPLYRFTTLPPLPSLIWAVICTWQVLAVSKVGVWPVSWPWGVRVRLVLLRCTCRHWGLETVRFVILTLSPSGSLKFTVPLWEVGREDCTVPVAGSRYFLPS